MNWLDMYDCDDSCADDWLNDFCDVIDSLSPNSSTSPSFVTHTLDLTLKLKPLYDFLKYTSWVLMRLSRDYCI